MVKSEAPMRFEWFGSRGWPGRSPPCSLQGENFAVGRGRNEGAEVVVAWLGVTEPHPTARPVSPHPQASIGRGTGLLPGL